MALGKDYAALAEYDAVDNRNWKYYLKNAYYRAETVGSWEISNDVMTGSGSFGGNDAGLGVLRENLYDNGTFSARRVTGYYEGASGVSFEGDNSTSSMQLFNDSQSQYSVYSSASGFGSTTTTITKAIIYQNNTTLRSEVLTAGQQLHVAAYGDFFATQVWQSIDVARTTLGTFLRPATRLVLFDSQFDRSTALSN